MHRQPLIKTIIAGALFGLVAGIVMYSFLMLTSIMIGISPDILSLSRGMSITHSYSNNNNINLILGIGMHLLTSIVAGMIFGFVINRINKFQIISFRKGISEGIIWAIIIFVILYIPTTISLVQPNLLEIIHKTNPNQNSLQNQQMVGQLILPLYGMGFIAHIVFGATLGFLMSWFILRIKNKNKLHSWFIYIGYIERHALTQPSNDVVKVV